MQTIRNCLLLLILIIYFTGSRYLSGWIPSTDETLINECLNQSLIHIYANQDSDISQVQVTNINCVTQAADELKIKLYFDLQDRRWECSLHRPTTEASRVEYDDCGVIEPENPSEQNQEKPLPSDDDEEDDEAEVDKLSQRKANNDEEHDDEEDINNEPTNENTNVRENNAQVSEQKTVDNNNDEEHDDEEDFKDELVNNTNDSDTTQQALEQNMAEDKDDNSEYKPSVPEENTRNQGENDEYEQEEKA